MEGVLKVFEKRSDNVIWPHLAGVVACDKVIYIADDYNGTINSH